LRKIVLLNKKDFLVKEHWFLESKNNVNICVHILILLCYVNIATTFKGKCVSSHDVIDPENWSPILCLRMCFKDTLRHVDISCFIRLWVLSGERWSFTLMTTTRIKYEIFVKSNWELRIDISRDGHIFDKKSYVRPVWGFHSISTILLKARPFVLLYLHAWYVRANKNQERKIC
jgi:hypothetical protein